MVRAEHSVSFAILSLARFEGAVVATSLKAASARSEAEKSISVRAVHSMSAWAKAVDGRPVWPARARDRSRLQRFGWLRQRRRAAGVSRC